MPKLSEDLFYANIETKSTRQGFGDALVELGEKYENLIVLTGDLKESTKADKFAEKFPHRFIEVGVAEQNLAGISAGLALSGKLPVMTSYSIFVPGQNWAQIRLSIAYSNLNVKMVSSHAGLSATQDGASHQALEDIALMRVLPNVTVLAPADYLQAKKAIATALAYDGPVYLRLTKNETPVFTTEETDFEVGGSNILNEGTDLTIVSSGPITYEVLKAARELELKHRIYAEVIDTYSLKPFDEDTLIKSAKKTKKVVTVEEHQVAGGLGGIVAEILSAQLPTPLYRIGMMDSFGESGKYEELIGKYGLDAKSIVEKIKKIK